MFQIDLKSFICNLNAGLYQRFIGLNRFVDFIILNNNILLLICSFTRIRYSNFKLKNELFLLNEKYPILIH